jgi:glycosyltransferase involved in cell wall biosynthesis
MDVSVIVPAYNEERFIARCLDSLVNQDDPAEEIIVVDNNSTDRTVAVAQRYPVRIIRETRQGIIPARNAGFDAAAGDVLARCDADSIVPADWVRRIRAHFATGAIDGLSGWLVYYDHWLLKRTARYSGLYMACLRLSLGHETLMGPNMAISKRVWEQVRDEVCLDDTQVHEDVDLSIHVARFGTIRVDGRLLVQASARRLTRNPLSFFVEYPTRIVRTLRARHRGASRKSEV